MNITLPPQHNSTPNVPAAAQVTSLATNESSLHSEQLSWLLRGLVFRWKINQSITQNENQQILTGVKVMDMQAHPQTLVNHNANTEHFAASINKLPVALLVLQDLRAGKLNLDQTMTWVASDRRDGGGVYDVPGSTTSATLREVLFDMLNRSGNTAVRILVNYGLDGAAAVNERWAQVPELSHTYLMPLDGDPSRFYLGNTTPHDSLWTLQRLLRNQDSYGAFIKNALATNIYTDTGARSQLAGNDYIVLVNKLGLLNDPDGNNRHDVGVIYNTKTHRSYGYALMATSPQANEAATPQAEQSLKDMGRYTLRYGGDKPQSQPAPSTLRQSAPATPEGKVLY